MPFKMFALPVICLFILALPAFCEELAPGYEACLKRAESFDQEADCSKMAHQYQSKRLDASYKRLRQLCAKAEDADLCRKELKKLELAWLEFARRVNTYMLNEGIFGPYNYDNRDDSDDIGRARRNAESFSANETKRQADRFDLFYKLYERWQ